MRDSPEVLASIPVDRFATLINRSAPFRRSLISTPGHHPRIPGNQSQHECRHILINPTVTNSTDRRISSQIRARNRSRITNTTTVMCASIGPWKQSQTRLPNAPRPDEGGIQSLGEVRGHDHDAPRGVHYSVENVQEALRGAMHGVPHRDEKNDEM